MFQGNLLGIYRCPQASKGCKISLEFQKGEESSLFGGKKVFNEEELKAPLTMEEAMIGFFSYQECAESCLRLDEKLIKILKRPLRTPHQ